MPAPNNAQIATVSLLPDEAIDNATKFGFDDYSTALASIIKDKNLQTPFTIAIHGDWGSGKTSLMKTIAKKLESSDIKGVKVKSIWFSAWEFEKLKMPLWNIFLNHVIMELQEMMPNDVHKTKIKAIGQGILALSGEILFRKIVGVSLKDVEKIKEKVWKDIERINSLREELSKCIEKALKKDPKKRRRLAIFIDDLDRCLPEQCVEIFESIKLFLSCKNCVFVVGVDREQVRKAFQLRFQATEDEKGLAYVEKFTQLQFDLPRKTPEEVKEFLLEHASEQLKKNPKTIELISKFVAPNPRKIKRWLNSVLFLERLFRIKQEKLSLVYPVEIDVSIASIWLFLRSFFPDFAIFVESDLSMLNTAIRVARGEGAKEDKQKIGDFTIDKRLAEFLSLLTPDYNEDQLKDIVYLSELTPAQYVSVLPRDILNRIAEMTEEELSDQLTLLSKDSILSLVDRLVDNLSQIPNWRIYEEKIKLFDLLNLLFEGLEEDLTKAAMLNKILEFMLTSIYAYGYFCPKLETYISQTAVRRIVIEEKLLDKIIMVFAKSNSFERAKQNSAILLDFINDLTQKQVNTIIEASLENDQIYDSWGAQKNLKTIFQRHKAKIQAEKVKEIEKNLDIKL